MWRVWLDEVIVKTSFPTVWEEDILYIEDTWSWIYKWYIWDWSSYKLIYSISSWDNVSVTITNFDWTVLDSTDNTVQKVIDGINTFLAKKPAVTLTTTSFKGWVRNWSFTNDVTKTDSTATSSYETTIIHSGTRSLKIAYTAWASDYVSLTDFVNVENTKKYKLTFWAYSSVSKSIKVNLNATSQTVGTFTITPNQWNIYVAEFTATWNYTNLRLLTNDTTASDIYFDDFRLDRVIETTNDNLETSNNSIVWFGSTTTITTVSQSQTSDNQYQPINNWWANQASAQQFLPTKKKFAGFCAKASSDTGTATQDVKFNVQTDNTNKPSWTKIIEKTITNAQWDASIWSCIQVELPALLTVDWSTTYHLVLEPSAQWDASNYLRHRFNTAGGYTSGIMNRYDWSNWQTVTGDWYFNTYYAKPTNWLNIWSHNVWFDINLDEDWLNNNTRLDIYNWKYMYHNDFNSTQAILDIYSELHPWTWDQTNWYYSTPSDTTAQAIVIKINTWLRVKGNLDVTSILFNNNVVTGKLEYSYNNVEYYNLLVLWASASEQTNKLSIPMDWFDQVYIKISKDTTDGYIQIRDLKIEWIIDNDEINFPPVYPTAKDLYGIIIGRLESSVEKVFYRATKYWFPALEYTDGSDVYIGYQFLPIDTTWATNSSTTTYIKISDTNISTASKLSDGESITLWTPTTIPVIYFDIKIASNRLLVSSNDTTADTSKDGSLEWTITYKSTNQGLYYQVQDIQKEIDEIKHIYNSDILSTYISTPTTTSITTNYAVIAGTYTSTNIRNFEVTSTNKIYYRWTNTNFFRISYNTSYVSDTAAVYTTTAIRKNWTSICPCSLSSMQLVTATDAVQNVWNTILILKPWDYIELIAKWDKSATHTFSNASIVIDKLLQYN